MGSKNNSHNYGENLLKDKKFTKFFLKGKELEKSCLFALCNEYYKKTDDYFKRLGFTYGGPLCLAFIEWFYPLLKENKFSDVLFISRDGWILKKVFEILYPNSKIKAHYIYASREICKNVDFQEYKKYLEKQNIVGKKIALVDMVAKNYTAHKFLQQFFKEVLTGYYFRLMKNNRNLLCYEYEQGSRIYNWDFVEFLITAPEYPGKDIKNGQIIYEEDNEFEKIRKNIYVKISDGICAFIRAFKNKYHEDKYLNLDNYFVINWINSLWSNLTKQDIFYLSSVYFTTDHNLKEYKPLITKNFFLFCNIINCLPFLSLQCYNATVEIRLFNKIAIFKRIIIGQRKIFYFWKIPIFCRNIK